MLSSNKLFFSAIALSAILGGVLGAAAPLEKRVDCPANSSPNASGSNCVCDSGYYSGGTLGNGFLKT